MEALVKICTKCGKKKSLGEFHKTLKYKDGLAYYCKTCKEKYYENNKTKISGYKKKWRNKNKEKIRVYRKKYDQQERNNLHDNYMKILLIGKSRLKSADIPPELIELKRAEIKLKRLIKEKSNG